MGGYGSGRKRSRSCGTMEENRSLDVNKLNHAGCLQSGWHGGWEWTVDGERVAWIQIAAEESRLRLEYSYRRNGGDWEDINQPAPLTWMPCRFGGKRPYFLCPGVVDRVSCGRRVMKLYGADRYFLCRHCHHLSHASQGEAPWDRALRRANRIRMKLGGDPGTANQFPDKPIGMWHRTYERLREENSEAEHLADALMMLHLTRGARQNLFADMNRSFWT